MDSQVFVMAELNIQPDSAKKGIDRAIKTLGYAMKCSVERDQVIIRKIKGS